MTADQALAQRREAAPAPTRREETAEWLRDLLADGPVAARQMAPSTWHLQIDGKRDG
jgi:hypothetical protein